MKNVSRVPWCRNLAIIQGAFVLIITSDYKQIFRLHMMSGLRHSFASLFRIFCFEKRKKKERSDFDCRRKHLFIRRVSWDGEICARVGEYGAETWQIDVKQQIYFFRARKNLTNFFNRSVNPTQLMRVFTPSENRELGELASAGYLCRDDVSNWDDTLILHRDVNCNETSFK